MATYSSKDFLFSIATHDVTAFLTAASAAKITALIEDVTPFGATWFQHVATGIQSMGDLTLAGVFDTTANAPVALLRGQQGTTVACVMTIGGTKTFTFNAIVVDTSDTAVVKKMTMFGATLRPTGSVTIA
jgi:hypothetical protein